MGTGFLEVVTTAAFGGMPVEGAKVTVFSGDIVLYEMMSDESGLTEAVALEAPNVALTLDVNYEGVPYSVADVKVEAKGYATIIIHDVEILDTETSILPVQMIPATMENEIVEIYIPPHNLVSGEPRKMDVPPEPEPAAITPFVLDEVIIPEFITVHLGRPDNAAARNVRVPFTYYIKNSASHEIFSTWPPASLEANIYCIISLTLNRIFTEWYRVRGHNFDITNSTQFDQMFVYGGQIYATIDRMVDLIFNRYLRRQGHLEPFFAEYCDGRRVQCPGLWQWGTVTLAQQGLNALQILHQFYPNDVQIVETNNIGGVEESFPGYTLRSGMSGPAVRTLQTWLNRIGSPGNFPAIPPITNVSGVFGPQTEAAVRAFQSIRMLGTVAPNGVVDRATWNNISRAYSAVKRLGELVSEGIIIGIGRTPPTEIIRQGSRGRLVQQAQYILNFISNFNPAVPSVLQNSNFSADMAAAVREFQRNFGLNPDGSIGPLTWARLYQVYWSIRDNANLPPPDSGVVPPLPPGPGQPGPGQIPPFPGQALRVGSRGENVRLVQRCLNDTRYRYPSIQLLNVDGIFGPLTEASVREFQRLFGLAADGVVGQITWNALMPQCYGTDPPPPPPQNVPPFPGTLFRVGSRGAEVQRIQRCLNQVNNAGLNVDGIFGPLTQAAVINFQRSRGLNPDGIVGPITWGALMPACYGGTAPPPPQPNIPPFPGFLISVGSRGNYVRQIQSCLNSVNNAGLNTDGIFGPLTQAAVINYQRAHNLATNGIVGPITWAHLMTRCGSAIPRIMADDEHDAMSVMPVMPAASPAMPARHHDIAPLDVEYTPHIMPQIGIEAEMKESGCGCGRKETHELNINNLLMYLLLRQKK